MHAIGSHAVLPYLDAAGGPDEGEMGVSPRGDEGELEGVTCSLEPGQDSRGSFLPTFNEIDTT